MRQRYDYIVVGSGAGGGPLAANLARAGKHVLLLEAGGDDEGYTYQVPAFHPLATEDASLRWDYFVRHYSADELQARDPKYTSARNGVLYPRAGTLGGCTAHNAMITVYPHNQDWDAIATLTGDPSWRSELMRTYFERLEHCRYVPRTRVPRVVQPLFEAIRRWLPAAWSPSANPSRHGFDGWLSTELADPRLAIADNQLLRVILDAVRATLAQDLGRELSLFEDLDQYVDPNDWRVQTAHAEGLWLTPLATSAGRRSGPRDYLRSVQRTCPGFLTIKTHALASRILLDGSNAAIGVEYLDGPHLYRADPHAAASPSQPAAQQVFADGEVIVCGGSFNSPQLLQLSGIGPRQQLEALGIPVRLDLPGVGENLQDRYEIGVVSQMHDSFTSFRECAFEVPSDLTADPCFTDWLTGTGPYTSNGVVLSIIKKSRKDLPEPDLFIFGLPGDFRGYFPGYSRLVEARRDYLTWAILKAHTANNAGRVSLRSRDPRDPPDVNFHYFEEGSDAEGRDLAAVIAGVEFVRRLLAQAHDCVKSEVLPGAEVRTQAQLADFVRSHAWGHHACGTCRIGPPGDPMAVVDEAFRVHGAKHLRVVDASVFPTIPGFFIVTPVYMLSEKATDVILADA